MYKEQGNRNCVGRAGEMGSLQAWVGRAKGTRDGNSYYVEGGKSVMSREDVVSDRTRGKHNRNLNDNTECLSDNSRLYLS